MPLPMNNADGNEVIDSPMTPAVSLQSGTTG